MYKVMIIDLETGKEQMNVTSDVIIGAFHNSDSNEVSVMSASCGTLLPVVHTVDAAKRAIKEACSHPLVSMAVAGMEFAKELRGEKDEKR